MRHPETPLLNLHGRLRRAGPWALLLALLGVAQTLLVVLAFKYENTRAQDETDTLATEMASEMRRDLLGQMQTLQALAFSAAPAPAWREEATALLRKGQGLWRVERRKVSGEVLDEVDTPYAPTLVSMLPRKDMGVEAELACTAASRAAAPMFSRSYFVPLAGGKGVEAIDLCLPLQQAGQPVGYLVGSLALPQVLDAALRLRDARRHEMSIVEGDGTRLARAGVPRGAGVYVAERVVDLPGASLLLRVDAAAGRPSVIPNLVTALVLGLSLALFGVVLMLARDVRRRAAAEQALAEALAFRKAMEDSLSTGLRARDLQGRITYANPAFCAMVGRTQEELRQVEGRPPYWPPEFAAEYLQRQNQRLQGLTGRSSQEQREGFETVFMRQNGERFPVMIYDAPLVDGQGQHTGWMSAVLDLSAQRRVEEISRQQQDRLQATARLATVGEMASLLSHELNQPLSAIASYAAGSLNLLETPDVHTPGLMRQALERIAEQAERAGRVIKSVHDFVRRRDQVHEAIGADVLIEAVLPLVRLQARKSGARIEVDLPAPVPRVRCDRTMLEQVLLNLTRNGIQAMETGTDVADRVLTLRVRQTQARWVAFSVLDTGHGIPAEAAARLFTPLFTTKAEGMGLGLSLCRTVVEQHGGVLDFGPGPQGRGTEFRFTLPVPKGAETGDTVGPATAYR
jgi:two-component system sensor histidine kinase DctS